MLSPIFRLADFGLERFADVLLLTFLPPQFSTNLYNKQRNLALRMTSTSSGTLLDAPPQTNPPPPPANPPQTNPPPPPANPPEPLPTPRLYVDKKAWVTLKKQIELKSRILSFRFPKPTTSQVKQLVQDAIGYEVRTEDAYFEKGCCKVHQNISSWKYETIEAMIRWVGKLLLAQPMLEYVREDKLFGEMKKNFDVHAAESVFSHVAAYYQLHVSAKSNAGIWITDFFSNLAVMVKLHLENKHAEDSERAVLLDFYDMFGKLEEDIFDEGGKVVGTKIVDDPVYANITLSDFKLREDKKPRRVKKVVKRRKVFGHTALPTPPESSDGNAAGAPAVAPVEES